MIALVAALVVNLAALDGAPNRVHVAGGAEYGVAAAVGYGRVVPVLGRPFVLTGDATLPVAGLDVNDHRVRVGAVVPIAGAGPWRLAGGLAPSLRGTRNHVGRMTALGVELGVVGGYYVRRWWAAGELELDWAMTTYVAHDEAYRTRVYADARDGWYASPGGNVRVGAVGGVTFGRYELGLRAGAIRDVGGAAPLLPFYATLAFSTRW